MYKYTIYLLLILCLVSPAFGQSYNSSTDFRIWGLTSIGKGNNNPTFPGALLELGMPGTNKGILLPRAFDTTSIQEPAFGMFGYFISQQCVGVYDGGSWNLLPKGLSDSLRERITITAAAARYIPLLQKGVSNGVANLDGAGKIPYQLLPDTVFKSGKNIFNSDGVLTGHRLIEQKNYGLTFTGSTLPDNNGIVRSGRLTTSATSFGVLHYNTDFNTSSAMQIDMGEVKLNTTTPSGITNFGINGNSVLMQSDGSDGSERAGLNLYSKGLTSSKTLFGLSVTGGGSTSNFEILGTKASLQTELFGIGTDQPVDKLHVSGNILSEGQITVSGNLSKKYPSSIITYINPSSGGGGGNIVYIGADNNLKGQFYFGEDGSIAISPKNGITNVIGAVRYSGALQLREGGAAAAMGLANLPGGTTSVVINTVLVTANSRIFLTVNSVSDPNATTNICVSSRTPGNSFTITWGKSAAVSGTIAWQIVEPY